MLIIIFYIALGLKHIGTIYFNGDNVALWSQYFLKFK
jgi:hypothetical protein